VSNQWIEQRLPPIAPIPTHTEPDLYGASHIIAEQIERAAPGHSIGRWQHGWLFFPPKFDVEVVVDNGPEDVYLVATEDVVRFLREHGYRNAFAVGLPFAYADPSPFERVPGSLLVMPPHSLAHTRHTWKEGRYAEEIAALKDQFSTIVACVSVSCVRKGYWTSTFDRYGIPWIEGATPDDANALKRLHALFGSFEYVTTNAIGSHVAYAASVGCKVSLYGQYASYGAEDFQDCKYFQKYPEVLDYTIHSCQEDAVRMMYPDLFVNPKDAVSRIDWGRAMIGADNRRSGYVVAALLGWSQGGAASSTRGPNSGLLSADRGRRLLVGIRNQLRKMAGRNW
jgi:hypothetical protein